MAVIVRLHSAWPMGSKKTRMRSTDREPHDGLDDVERVLHLAVHQAGVSTSSTQEKFLSLLVEISVKTLSEMPLKRCRPSMWS